ncbi:NAD(P)/FAD-dependent oxidoreductase [Acuticoccus sp. MNP-M23]|uniref:NAD(P)/FAD-dependent oxidoreductase n=1 Tax=Acuticoccus sp. MNP-M23 TaxID=3072793 RepID=UPI002814D4FB|nr:NAD(P)/FAD-dependent oxidoreductase [Acuticoccus sp. MNP-M23]WMS41058.1 NAD(P)/FAD-dependent oxidoreductase [Acuticoccus sp. MNP-M23]
MAYPALSWIDGMATTASAEADGITVRLADGSAHSGKRLILAIGVSDTLPPVKGLAERWGNSILHCPYCHGYELDGQPIAVLASGEIAIHQALVCADWGPVTLLLNDAFVPADADLQALAARKIATERSAVTRIEGTADVRLADGRVLPFAGIFVAPRNAPSTGLAATLGCAVEESPFGTQIRVDGTGETSVPGVFACGDAAAAPHSISLAVASGAMTGARAHQSLIF